MALPLSADAVLPPGRSGATEPSRSLDPTLRPHTARAGPAGWSTLRRGVQTAGSVARRRERAVTLQARTLTGAEASTSRSSASSASATPLPRPSASAPPPTPLSQRWDRAFASLLRRTDALQPEYRCMSDDELRLTASRLRARFPRGAPAPLRLLPHVCAAVREAAERVLGQRMHAAQVQGAAAMCRGLAVEMATGEGKTLAATIPAFFFALQGRGVHVLTANAYLAARDARWVGKVLAALGLSIGVVEEQGAGEDGPPGEDAHGAQLARWRAAFEADVTYATAQQLGFLVLGDAAALSARDLVVRRPLHACIIDEIDAILIDESTHSLVLSGPSPQPPPRHQLEIARRVAARLVALRAAPSAAQELDSARGRKLLARLRGDGPPADAFVVPERRAALLSTQGQLQAARLLLEEGGACLALGEGGEADAWAVLLCEDAVSDAASPSLAPDSASPPPVSSLVAIQVSTGRVLQAGLEEGAAERDPSASLESWDAALASLRLRRVAAPSPSQTAAAAHALLWAHAASLGKHVLRALRARHCFRQDGDYIVRGGQVVIVDPLTGRLRPNTRWGSGVHLALEAQHGLALGRDQAELASINYAALFRLYRRLAGMSGTVRGPARELREAYGGLRTLAVLPHRPCAREDAPMEVYATERDAMRRLAEAVRECMRSGRPVLVASPSVEHSERLHWVFEQLMRGDGEKSLPDDGAGPRAGPPFPTTLHLLNARPDRVRREAELIAQAGLPGAVTVATSLAGRGTDILLGGSAKGLTRLALGHLLGGGGGEEEGSLPIPALLRQSLADLPPALRVAADAARQEAFDCGEAGGGDGRPLSALEPVLETLIERVEELRAHFVLDQRRAGRAPGGEGDCEEASAWLTNQPLVDKTALDLSVAFDSFALSSPRSAAAFSALLRACLLLWLWMDAWCARQAAQARALGGLCVLLSGLQSPRTEAQLRGRAGRQGDPGASCALSSFAEPALAAGLPRLVGSQLELHSRLSGGAPLGRSLARHALRAQRALEDLRTQDREQQRRSDGVLDPFRRMGWALRRSLLQAGGRGGGRRGVEGCLRNVGRWMARACLKAGGGSERGLWNAAAMVDDLPLHRLLATLQAVVNGAARLAPLVDQHAAFQAHASMLEVLPGIGALRLNLSLFPPNAPDQLAQALLQGRELPLSRPLEEDLSWDEEEALERDWRRGQERSGSGPGWMHALRRWWRRRTLTKTGALRRLEDWAGDQLVEAYWQKKVGEARVLRQMSGASLDEGMEALWVHDRRFMVAGIDSLWSRFLQDIKTLEAASGMRSFSHLRPEAELQLESAAIFENLLQDLEFECVERAFAGIDARALDLGLTCLKSEA